MTTRMKIAAFCISMFLCIGCDRVTKGLAKTHLMNKTTVSYFNDFVQFMYVENTGAAMSLGDNLPKTASLWLLGILPLAFLLFLCYYILRNAKEMRTMKLISFALIISGGLGNIIDRLLYDRHVTDFVVIGTDKLRTGVFNFADVCVTAGAIGLLFFYNDKKKKAHVAV